MGLTRPKYSQIYDSDWKNSCRVVTSSTVTLVGGAPNSVDGVSLNQYDRVLVRAQTSVAQNGIYFVTVVGTGANGTWVRALDADTSDKLTSGASVSISEGTVSAGKSYRLTTPDPIVLGTTGLTFTDSSGGGGASAGGTNGQVQVNSQNTFNGALYLYYNSTTGLVTANAGITSTSSSTGTFIVSGGVGVSGNVYSGGGLNTSAGLYATGAYNGGYTGDGLVIDHSNSFAAPGARFSAGTSDGFTFYNGGIGTTELFKIDGATGNTVVSATTVSSSTTTGAFVVKGGTGVAGAANFGSTATFGANVTVTGYVLPSANITYDIGSGTTWWRTFYGTSTQARYADLAEKYLADKQYPPGTVLVFGGANEVTTTVNDHDPRVAGIVSTNPAHLMNGGLTGEHVVELGLTGRLPCLVQGPVNKGDVLVTSTTPGVAQKINNSKFVPGCVVGKALDTINSNNIQTIEVVVGRF